MHIFDRRYLRRPGGETRRLIMSANSARRRVITQRVEITGETKDAAAAGATRGNRIGLDACTSEQLGLRAHLGLHLFNANFLGNPVSMRGVGSVSCYDPIVSPRHDSLVLITSSPDNVVRRLVPRAADSGGGLPGLRVEALDRSPGYTIGYRMVHLPTGGRLVVTLDEDGCFTDTLPALPDVRGTLNRCRTLVGDPTLDSAEEYVLDSLPAMSTDTQQLIAALTVRLNARDPRRRWAIGSWSWDLLDRDRPDRRSRGHGEMRRLWRWGLANRWELRWNGFPYPDDVAGALSDEVAGLPGASVCGGGEEWEVTLGDARLDVRPW